jgi:hypothetical protein
MHTLLNTFLNLLGYYQLSATDYAAYYGLYYYIPSIQQLYKQVDMSDQVLVDVASAQITGLIEAQLTTTNSAYEVTYDFIPLFAANNTTSLQGERVMNDVMNNLENKGYKIYNTDVATKFIIRWKFKTFRMFQRIQQIPTV